MQCPACKGTGLIEIKPNTKYAKTLLKRKAARALVEAGISIRETQRLLGFKDKKSVQDALKEENGSN